MLAGLIINFHTLLCTPAMSMEADPQENTAALRFFSDPDMVCIIRDNLRTQNALESHWSVYASCKYLQELWMNPEFHPIKHLEYLTPKKQEQLPTSPFLHWFLWTLEPDIETLQHMDLQFLHPFDERTGGGRHRLNAKARGDRGYIGWDYYVNLNLSAPIQDILSSLMVVRKMDQFFYPRDIWSETPCLSVEIQANMWLGQVLLRKCVSDATMADYLNSFLPNIFSEHLSYSKNPYNLLMDYNNSLFYNQPVLKHPKIGLLFGIMATRNCSFSIYAPEIAPDRLKHRILAIIREVMCGLIHKRREYKEKSITLCECIRKELFETAIQAKIPNAWEIYENMCLLLNENKVVDNIGGIQKPD